MSNSNFASAHCDYINELDKSIRVLAAASKANGIQKNS